MTHTKNPLLLGVLLSVILLVSPFACSTAPRKISEPAVTSEKPTAKEIESEEITPELDDLRGYLLPAR
ncbi:MAG: hypothetical protein ACP5I1_02735 [Candidatus Hinthialibacter sp.]